MKHIGHLLGALIGAVIIAIWGLLFMCLCRVVTGQWWMTDDINQGNEMLLTDDDIEFLADGIAIDDFSHDLARRVERVVVAKLCAGVSMPEPVALGEYYDGSNILGFEYDQLSAYGAACRVKALEDAAELCDRFAERDMHPAECAAAIRALKGEAA